MTPNGPPHLPSSRNLADVVDEANTLLGSNRLHRHDVRWLSGRLVHVLISPVDPSDAETGIAVTLAHADGTPSDLAGLTISVTDAHGETVWATLDDHGHTLVHLATDTYRLSVDAPAEVGHGPRALLEMSEAVVPMARSGAGGRRRLRRRVDDRRPTRSRAAALWALPAAVVVLFASALVVVGEAPAEAVRIRKLTPDCTAPAKERANHVEVVATWGDQEKDRFKEVLERFAAQTGIRVTLANANPDDKKKDGEPADRDLGRTLHSRIEGGCRPGVALLPQTGLLDELAGEGHLFPIKDVAGGLVDENYAPAWKELGSVGDTLYGVWFKASVKSLIWYNAAAFEKAGITQPPADWTSLKEVAAKLKAAGITPFAVAGATDDAWTLTDWFENVYLRTAGADLYDQLAQGKILWTHDTVVTALRTLAEVFGEPGWLHGGAEESLRTTFGGSVTKVFGNPKDPQAAMVFEGDFVATEVTKTRSRLDLDAKAFPFPSIASPAATMLSDGTSGAATGGDVAVLMRDDPEAKALLRYLATPEAAEPWIRAGGFVSPNKNARGYATPASETAAAGLAEAELIRFDLSDRLPVSFGGTPGEGMWLILQDFLRNPADAVATAEKLQVERVASG